MPNGIPGDTKQRALRLVLDHLDGYPNVTAACRNVAGRLGFGPESVRRGVRQARVDFGQREGATPVEAEEVRRLRKENRGFREANAILKDEVANSTGQRNSAWVLFAGVS